MYLSASQIRRIFQNNLSHAMQKQVFVAVIQKVKPSFGMTTTMTCFSVMRGIFIFSLPRRQFVFIAEKLI